MKKFNRMIYNHFIQYISYYLEIGTFYLLIKRIITSIKFCDPQSRLLTQHSIG